MLDVHLNTRVSPLPQNFSNVTRNCRTSSAQEKSEILDNLKIETSPYLFFSSLIFICYQEVYPRYSRRIAVRPAFQINSKSWYCDQSLSSLTIHGTSSSFGFIPARLSELGCSLLRGQRDLDWYNAVLQPADYFQLYILQPVYASDCPLHLVRRGWARHNYTDRTG